MCKKENLSYEIYKKLMKLSLNSGVFMSNIDSVETISVGDEEIIISNPNDNYVKIFIENNEIIKEITQENFSIPHPNISGKKIIFPLYKKY
jgi:hypothetical protein